MIFTEMPLEESGCVNVHTWGEICIDCGCCKRESNYKNRTINCLKYYKERLKEELNFNEFDKNPVIRRNQEEIVRENILDFKRKIRIYKKILRTIRK